MIKKRQSQPHLNGLDWSLNLKQLCKLHLFSERFSFSVFEPPPASFSLSSSSQVKVARKRQRLQFLWHRCHAGDRGSFRRALWSRTLSAQLCGEWNLTTAAVGDAAPPCHSSALWWQPRSNGPLRPDPAAGASLPQGPWEREGKWKKAGQQRRKMDRGANSLAELKKWD